MTKLISDMINITCQLTIKSYHFIKSIRLSVKCIANTRTVTSPTTTHRTTPHIPNVMTRSLLNVVLFRETAIKGRLLVINGVHTMFGHLLNSVVRDANK